MPMSDDWVLKDRYEFECAACLHVMWFAPSLMMKLGRNSGAARCENCEKYLHLEIDDNNERGLSIVFSEWVASFQLQQGES